MKRRIFCKKLGQAIPAVFLAATFNLTARERYDDLEARGKVLEINPRHDNFKMSRGASEQPKYIHWNNRTKFLLDNKSASREDLKVGREIRVYYSEDPKRVGYPESGFRPWNRGVYAVASKVVINPTSDPHKPEYNR